jgi:hypothetical protein
MGNHCVKHQFFFGEKTKNALWYRVLQLQIHWTRQRRRVVAGLNRCGGICHPQIRKPSRHRTWNRWIGHHGSIRGQPRRVRSTQQYLGPIAFDPGISRRRSRRCRRSGGTAAFLLLHQTDDAEDIRQRQDGLHRRRVLRAFRQRGLFLVLKAPQRHFRQTQGCPPVASVQGPFKLGQIVVGDHRGRWDVDQIVRSGLPTFVRIDQGSIGNVHPSQVVQGHWGACDAACNDFVDIERRACRVVSMAFEARMRDKVSCFWIPGAPTWIVWRQSAVPFFAPTVLGIRYAFGLSIGFANQYGDPLDVAFMDACVKGKWGTKGSGIIARRTALAMHMLVVVIRERVEDVCG